MEIDEDISSYNHGYYYGKIIDHLNKIGYTKKQIDWMPYELTLKI